MATKSRLIIKGNWGKGQSAWLKSRTGWARMAPPSCGTIPASVTRTPNSVSIGIKWRWHQEPNGDSRGINKL